MLQLLKSWFFLVLILLSPWAIAQSDSTLLEQETRNQNELLEYQIRINKIEQQRIEDSIQRVALETQINALKTTDNIKKEALQQQLKDIGDREISRRAEKKAKIDLLRQNTIGYPVIGILHDTLFHIYAKLGAHNAQERAKEVTRRIKKLYEDDYLQVDSIEILVAEISTDIVYKYDIITSITETDAIWSDSDPEVLAARYLELIKSDITHAKAERGFFKVLMRAGLTLLIIICAWLLIRFTAKFNQRLKVLIEQRKSHWLKNLSYKNYTLLSPEQELKIIIAALNVLRWFIIALILYIAFPIIFSIFPFTRGWADILFNWILSPFKSMLAAIWSYFPNLIQIVIIYFVMKYVIRFVRYIFAEIETGKLNISGFYVEWAMPTFNIIKFLLYAFMLVLIFPLLPGSDSQIFKGVSIFIGVLFSMGSSSAIANMVAGLVITYMRPFKIGDRIKIGDIWGDVVEKNLLITRLKTVKNEEITIPNSSVLSGNTVNYSAYSKSDGLIIHSTVTIGYDVPWKDMQKALVDAALKTALIMPDPTPFVLQSSLDDFFISYQINAYTHEANKQAAILSELHQNIQDICNERGIEILSPHYRAQRDGNNSTIPASYLGPEYASPAFKVEVKQDKS